MKPISVRFQCFGPYVQEQFVDFTQLEKHGLFLICGETGSGKTTILDAMCYALYGKSSGGLRGDMSVMRCKQADPKDETFVEFIFDCGESRYRFFRSMKPRKKRKTKENSEKKQSTQSEFNTVCECQILTDGVFTPLSDAKDKASFLNATAEQLIGLTYDQFRQVIILPQGQFEKLLVSNSEDKEAILVTLFHAERWQTMATKLFDLADARMKELDKEKLLITDKLKYYGCSQPEELSEKASAAAASLVALVEALAEAEVDVSKQQQLQNTALLDNQVFEQCANLKKQLDKLADYEEAFREEAKILAKAELAATLAVPRQKYLDARGQLYNATAEQVRAQDTLKSAETAWTSAQKAQLAHESGRESHIQNKQRILQLQNAKAVYTTLAEKEDAVLTRKILLARDEADSERTKKTFTQANAAWEAAILEQRKAVEEYDLAQEAYLRGIGSTLAQQLQEGKPCPVCGSLSHPSPAPLSQDHVTEAQLNAYTKARNKANKQEETLRKQRMEAEKTYNAAHTALTESQRALAVAEAELSSAKEQLIPRISTEEGRSAALKRLTRETEEYERIETRITEDLNSANAALQVAKAGLEKAKNSVQSVSEDYELKRSEWNTALEQAGFESELDYTRSCIDSADLQKRQTRLVTFRTRLEETQKAYDEKHAELVGRQQPDVAAAEKALAEAQNKRDQIRSNLLLAQKEQETMQREADLLATRAKRYEKERSAAEERMVFAKRLRGDFGISLQRYVLGVMLTSITTAANQLLKTVYAGRYQLFRTNESSGTARKRGLELEVYDANSGERRSVTTLSGGEKFLVALSLAIGLSTVVQAQGTGVRLEAMFIDEGFGSLDRESVNDALEVLHGIRRSSALVGIISHVEQLSETIPAKIRITKGKDGSQCKIEC